MGCRNMNFRQGSRLAKPPTSLAILTKWAYFDMNILMWSKSNSPRFDANTGTMSKLDCVGIFLAAQNLGKSSLQFGRRKYLSLKVWLTFWPWKFHDASDFTRPLRLFFSILAVFSSIVSPISTGSCGSQAKMPPTKIGRVFIKFHVSITIGLHVVEYNSTSTIPAFKPCQNMFS